MLEAEMETHLGYEKHDVKAKETPNSRNGKNKKTVVSEYGEQEISVPRDRLGEFEPLVVKKPLISEATQKLRYQVRIGSQQPSTL